MEDALFVTVVNGIDELQQRDADEGRIALEDIPFIYRRHESTTLYELELQVDRVRVRVGTIKLDNVFVIRDLGVIGDFCSGRVCTLGDALDGDELGKAGARLAPDSALDATVSADADDVEHLDAVPAKGVSREIERREHGKVEK